MRTILGRGQEVSYGPYRQMAGEWAAFRPKSRAQKFSYLNLRFKNPAWWNTVSILQTPH